MIGAAIGILFGFVGAQYSFRGLYILFKIANKNISRFQCNRDIKNFYSGNILSIFSGLYPAFKGSRISPVNA